MLTWPADGYRPDFRKNLSISDNHIIIQRSRPGGEIKSYPSGTKPEYSWKKRPQHSTRRIMEDQQTPTPRIDCYRCRHYYITWDKSFPHGCRAMKFKARTLPGAAVVKSSGIPCLYHEPRQKAPDKFWQSSDTVTCLARGKKTSEQQP